MQPPCIFKKTHNISVLHYLHHVSQLSSHDRLFFLALVIFLHFLKLWVHVLYIIVFFAISPCITFHMYVSSQRFKSFQTYTLYALCCVYTTIITLHHLPYSFICLNFNITTNPTLYQFILKLDEASFTACI